MQSEVKPEQAWTPTEKVHTAINSATMLGAIGELSNQSWCAKKFPPREEVDAHDCAHCLHHLRWDCCNFLFWCDLNFDEVEKGAELFLLLVYAQLHIAQEASEDCDFIFHSCPTQYKLQNEINRPWHLLILTCVPFQYVTRFFLVSSTLDLLPVKPKNLKVLGGGSVLDWDGYKTSCQK